MSQNSPMKVSVMTMPKTTTLPRGWKTAKLGTLFTERDEANCPDLELLSVTGTRGIIPRSYIEGKDNSNEDKGKYLKVCKGDIAYNTMRMWQGVSALSEYSGIVSPAYTVLKANDNACAEYFQYLFKLQSMIFKFYRWSQGLVDDQRSLKYHNFSIISVNIPPLPEQRAIGEILTTADKIIATKERHIAAKQHQKRWMMQNLLTGKMRLPGFSGEWEELSVSKLLTERNTQAPKNENYPLMAFIANVGISPKGERYDRSALILDEENKLYKRTELGDFIYSSNNLESGSIGLNKYGSASISPVYSIFKPTKITVYDYIGRLLTCKGFIGKMVRYRQGVIYGQWRIHEKDFLRIKVNVPPLTEQTAIAEILTTADREIELLTRELEEQKLIKKYLMQQLLTGKTRIKGASAV